jgi:hypothetical protein
VTYTRGTDKVDGKVSGWKILISTRTATVAFVDWCRSGLAEGPEFK